MISDPATGRIIDANKAIEKWSGYKRNELIGKTTLDIKLWANQSDREQFIKSLSARDSIGSSQVKLARKDGQERDVFLSARLIEIGDKTYILSLARDITEQKKVEKDLKESEERFRALHEASFGGIGIHDKGIILDCNHGLVHITGYSMDELIGMNGLDLIAPKWRELVMQNIVSGYEKTYDVEGVRKDGTTYPLEIIGKSIPYHGRTVRVTEFRDFTGRVQEQEALRESEDRYRKIVAAITDYIYTVHVEGGRAVSTEHSPACEAVTGYRVDEFNADPFLWLTMVVEDDREQVREYFNQVLMDRHVGPIEHRIYHKDGSVRWVSNMPVVHRDEAGAIISYDGVLSDITQRKKAEEAIRQRQAKLDSIFRAAPTGIGVVADRILLEVNDRICEMTGYSREELVGKPARIFYPTQEDSDYVGSEKYRQIRDKGTGTVETHWKKKDGTIIDILLSSTPIMPGDLLAGVTFTALDITERKRAEEALRESQQMLRLVLDTIPVRVFWKDKDSNYLGCNRQFAGDAGLASTEEVIGKNDFDLSWSEQADLYRGYDHEVISTGEPKLNYVQPETRSDGSLVWQRTSKVPLLDARGETKGVLGIYEDITQSKRIDEALKESEERYRLMAELTGKLVYDLDVPTGHITWHGAISQITGYSPEEFGAVDIKAFNEMIHPEDRTEVIVILEAALKECGPYNAEYCLRRKDGSNIFVEDRGVFLPDDKGRAIRMLGSLGDISVRKQAEEAIREAEKRYRTLFESANDAIFIMSEDRFIECNQMTLNMFGCDSKDDIFGCRPWEFSPIEQPDGRASTEKALEFINAAFDGTPQHFYWKHARKDGTPFDAEVTLNRIELGDQPYLQALVRDITERMKAEEALRQKTEELDRFFNITLDLLCIADTEGNFRHLNKAWEKTLDYTLDELKTRRFFDFIHPDDIQSTKDVVATLASQKEVVNFVNRYRHKDGTYRFLEWRSAPSGNLIYAAARDITERKEAEEALRESEERFRSLIQSSTDIIVILDENGLITYESPSMEQVLKYPAGEMIGKSPLDYIHPEDVGTVVTALAEVFEELNPGIPTEFRFQRADGTWVHLEAIGNNLINYPGINGVVITARDITERKKAEEQKLDMERRMLHAQKLESLGVMAGGIAHDFNNLLMAILGNLDLARLDLSPVSRSRPFIDQALKAGRRAADLTNQMLAYSGKGRFDLKPFDLSELVQEMAHLLKASISKTVTLNLQMEGNLPSIVADPSQIQQIIMNLIVNASEAVGDHPGVVTITTGALECDQDYLQDSRLKEKPNPGTYVFFEVRDTGCGMDEETKDRLFDPFFTTKFTGRGLGMAAVLGIVSGHKGAIMVESEPGEGATIRVMFPALQGKGTLKGVRTSVSIKEPEKAAEALASGMVLIADDEDMVLDLCRSMVERLGYKVITAKDGEEAVKIFHEQADGDRLRYLGPHHA